MNHPIIEYLKTHSFADLINDHGVGSRVDIDMTKVSLNYDTIDASSTNQLASACRGLIVRPRNLSVIKKDDTSDWRTDIVGDVDIIAWPMHRFFNHGDPNGAMIDWATAQTLEKLDGTMCILYWDDLKSRWCVATRAVPEADVGMNEDGLTFDTLFWAALKSTLSRSNMEVDTHLSLLEKDVTYVHELTTPENQLIVKHSVRTVTLLAARRLSSGREISPKHACSWLPVPQIWDVSSPEKITLFVNDRRPTDSEGVVITDANFNRIKIKSRAYVLSSRMTDIIKLSKRGVLEAVLLGTMDDVIVHLPENYSSTVDDLIQKLRDYCKRTDVNFKSWVEQSSGDRRTFARLVQGSGEWHVPYYIMMDGKAPDGAMQWLVSQAKADKLNTSHLESLIKFLGWSPTITLQ